MKILQLSKFYPPYKGGIELVAKMVTKSHTELGDVVKIISFGDSTKEYRGEFGENVSQIKSHLSILSTPMNFTKIFYILKQIELNQFDVIYIHLPNPFMHLISKMIKNLSVKTKIIGIYHSDIINQKILKNIYNTYFISTSAQYDKFIVSSDNLWKFSTTLKYIDVNKKSVIPFCTDENRQFQYKNNFSGKLLAIGRFVPYKGFEFLINTLNNTKYELTIIGDGPEFIRLKQKAAKNIKFLGRASEEEKTKQLNSNDILVMSSLNQSEAYGMIIVEAFEVAMPVLAPNIKSGVTYLCAHKERGLVYNIADPISLLSSLYEIENGPENFKKYSINARSFFDENLSYEVFKKNISHLTRSL